MVVEPDTPTLTGEVWALGGYEEPALLLTGKPDGGEQVQCFIKEIAIEKAQTLSGTL